ncbi:hypothetical protein BsWGS_27098 [Bradybaena similaris]
MSHYTHDLNLVHRLDQICKQRNDVLTKIWEKSPYKWNFKWSRPARDKQPLLFIVSHPHGCSKQISIGRCHSLLRHPNMHCGYTYTTATCPGSSGAEVHLLHRHVQHERDYLLSVYESIHRGVCDTQHGMNVSLLNQGSLFPVMVSQKLLLRDEEGPWKNICYLDEEDLRKHYDTCQNNPGHQNFFPVDKFSLDHLPFCRSKDEIMKLIKVLSDLTVRVSVRYVSEKRPETVPGTDIPYPWYRHRGGNQLRVGSGRITDVDFPDDEVCECEECKNSDAPIEREFALIYIRTSSHLVYDKLEGEHTTCHLCYDSGETPDACKDVMKLTNADTVMSGTFADSCTLVYCTHDLALAYKLKEFLRLYKDLKSQCYRSNKLEIDKQNDRKNFSPNPPLVIVVSHPHGRAKHVSISYPGCHDNTDTEENQSPYQSITCPGSSGAPVLTLGRQLLYPDLE